MLILNIQLLLSGSSCWFIVWIKTCLLFDYCIVQGASAVPKKAVKASESTSSLAGGLDGLPREDISGKVTPALLKSLESPDWKVLFFNVFHGSMFVLCLFWFTFAFFFFLCCLMCGSVGEWLSTIVDENFCAFFIEKIRVSMGMNFHYSNIHFISPPNFLPRNMVISLYPFL